MKMAMTVLFTGSLILSALTNANAQQTGAFASNATPAVFNFSNSKETGKELNSSEVNTNALSDFSKKNKTASQVMWTSNGSLLSVYFTKNEVKMRSTYTEKGKWEYTLRYLTASQAPKKVLDLISSTYGNVSIVQVTEIQRKGVTYHLVKMEDENSFLTVQVLNGEIDLFEKINK